MNNQINLIQFSTYKIANSNIYQFIEEYLEKE